MLVKSGRLKVTLNQRGPGVDRDRRLRHDVDPDRGLAQFESVGTEPAQFVVLTEGDGRVYLEWDPAVVAEAQAKDVALDPNGYLAPASLLNR